MNGLDSIKQTGDIATLTQNKAQLDALTNKVSNSITPKNMEQIEEAAKEFESVFFSEMLKPMFKEIKTDSMFGGGKGEDVYRDMMVKEYGQIMADKGGVGIADFVKAEMIRLQESLNAGETQ